MRTARRISQILFLLFFIFLFLQARYPYETWLPSDLFLRMSPLAGIAAIIASRQFIYGVLLSLALVLLTIPLGRFFCGWICPLGTIIDGSDNLIRRKKQNNKAFVNFRSWKFAGLVFIIVAAVFSVQIVGFLDPIALLTRTMTVAIYPAFVFLVGNVIDFLFRMGWFEDQIYTFYYFAQNTILPVAQPRFFEAAAIALIFLAILSLAMITRRFWCRNLCPLGALLGIFSKYRILNRSVNTTCTECGMCQRQCKMNAIEDDFTITNSVECIECAECVAVCPPRAISYHLGKNIGTNGIDISKRRFLQSALAGIAGLSLVKISTVHRNRQGTMIRPPGALPEDQFLDRCIRCLECSRICATTGNCLQPSVSEAGVESLWTPVAVPRNGYCEYSCNLCGMVCPTGAIQKLSVQKKQQVKMGTAFFDKSRCIPWYNHKDCLVCEEHCPTPDKAIKFDVREARAPDGSMQSVKFPYVAADLCIGCGICENKCPVIGAPGIYVTNAEQERVVQKL